jgi:hypothetical protein
MVLGFAAAVVTFVGLGLDRPRLSGVFVVPYIGWVHRVGRGVHGWSAYGVR